MKKTLVVIGLSLVLAQSIFAAAYYTGFEEDSKTSYTVGDVALSNTVWTLDSCVIGSLSADKKLEDYSLRMAYNGSVGYTGMSYMIETLTGNYSALSFKYAVYGSSSYLNDANLGADISTDDGASWMELAVVTFDTDVQDLTDFSTTFGPYQYVRLRLRYWDATCTYSRQRINVDNVALIPEPTTAAAAFAGLAGLVALLRRK